MHVPHALVLLEAKVITTLQKLGLTYYGAKVYATLVVTGSSTATVLSTESEVPRTKIYDVLRHLEERKWITVEKGRPAIYNPRYPKEVLVEKRDLFYSEFDHCLNELTLIYDRQIGKETYKVSLIRSVDNIFAKTLEMIGRARRRIVMILDIFPFSPAEVDRLRREITKAKKMDIIVRIITSQKIHSKNGRTDTRDIFPSLLSDIRFLPATSYYENKVGSTVLLIDNKEILQLYARVEADAPDLESLVALWIPDATITQHIVMNDIDRLWEEVTLLDPEFERETDGSSATLCKDTVTEEMLRNEGLNERQIRAVIWVRGREKITNKNYQELNDISRQTATIDLTELVNKNIFTRIGKAGRGIAYQLTKLPPNK